MTAGPKIAAFLCVSTLAAAARAAGPEAHAQTGAWQILSVAEAGSHRLDYCAAEAEFQGGFVLTVERDRSGRTVLVLQTQGPSFVPHAPYDARITIGAHPAIRSDGHASDANTLALPLPEAGGILSALGRSGDLSAALPRQRFLFALDGASTAMADLERCFADPGGGTLPPDGSLVERILDRSQNGPIQVARRAGAKNDADRDYAWSEGSVAGGAREVEIGPEVTFLDLVLGRLDRLASRCHGRFLPELDAPLEKGPGVVETGLGTCRETAGDHVAALLYFRSGRRFVEFIFEAPAEARAAAIKARDRILEFVRTSILIR